MSELVFRPIARSDFPLLGNWLQRPHVARWWADDPSPEALEADYGTCIDGSEPAEVFFAHGPDAPLGLIQRLRYADYPQYIQELQPVLPVPAHAISIDYFVGSPDMLGKGLGRAMISSFMQMTWTDWPDAMVAVVPVHAANTASWRALAGAGFAYSASGELRPDNPADSRDHVIYSLARPQF